MLMGYLIFIDYLTLIPLKNFTPMIKRSPSTVAFISLATIVILVIITKSLLGKGKPLHGGMPSGHAAIAFSLWVCIAFISKDILITILTLILCILVHHSRLLLKIHTTQDVLAGAPLGLSYIVLIFMIFG